MGTLQNVLPTIIQPQSRIFQKGIPVLLSAMQKEHLSFKKGTFFIILKVEGHVPPAPPPPPSYAPACNVRPSSSNKDMDA